MRTRSRSLGVWASRATARGVAAVEFALVTPIFCLLLAGIVDLGGALYTKFKLDSAVTAGANFAQVNAGNVSSANGADARQQHRHDRRDQPGIRSGRTTAWW